MIHVEIENIVPDQDAASRAGELFGKAAESKEVILITKEGRPSVAIIDVQKLEELTGRAVTPKEENSAPSPQPPVVDNFPPMPGLPPVPPAASASPTPPPLPSTPPPAPAPSSPAPFAAPAAPGGPQPLPPMSEAAGPVPLPGNTMNPAPTEGPSMQPAEPKKVAEDLPDMPVDPTNSSPLS